MLRVAAPAPPLLCDEKDVTRMLQVAAPPPPLLGDEQAVTRTLRAAAAAAGGYTGGLG